MGKFAESWRSWKQGVRDLRRITAVGARVATEAAIAKSFTEMSRAMEDDHSGTCRFDDADEDAFRELEAEDARFSE